jgi:hypothetical protein
MALPLSSGGAASVIQAEQITTETQDWLARWILQYSVTGHVILRIAHFLSQLSMHPGKQAERKKFNITGIASQRNIRWQILTLQEYK